MRSVGCALAMVLAGGIWACDERTYRGALSPPDERDGAQPVPLAPCLEPPSLGPVSWSPGIGPAVQLEGPACVP